MSEKKQMPKCPYCGWKMQPHFDYPRMKYSDVQFYCNSCGAMSPLARGYQCSAESSENALKEAYEKAMRRYEEPNRVLTLEEVLEIARQNEDGYNHVCWLEEEIICLISIPGILEGRGSRDGVYVNFDFNEILIKKPTFVKAEEYGKTWRCWMRNPTEQEMRDTPWEV